MSRNRCSARFESRQLANFFAPATQPITATVTISITGLTCSFNTVAKSASPNSGCSNCNCPTAAIPPCASPAHRRTVPSPRSAIHPHTIGLKHAAAISLTIAISRAITNGGAAGAKGDGMGWLFWIVEAALVLAASACLLIAAFLAPVHHETLATLASSRQTDLAIAAAAATLLLVAAFAVDVLRRRSRQADRL